MVLIWKTVQIGSSTVLLNTRFVWHSRVELKKLFGTAMCELGRTEIIVVFCNSQQTVP